MKQKILSLTFLMLGLLSEQKTFAYDFEVNGMYYSIISLPDLTVSVTNADGSGAIYTGTVTIPAQVTFRDKTFDVISISNYAFNGSSASQVNIPLSVKTIGNAAFSNSKLLESFSMPESVESIGTSLFSGCTSLKSIKLSSKLTKIPDRTFSNCNQLESLTIPDEVTFIGDYAFENCTRIKILVVPDKVSGIGYRCLSGMSSLNSLTLGKKCYSLDQYSLSGLTALKELIISVPDKYEYPYNISFDLMPLSSDAPIEHLFLGKQLGYRSGRYPFKNIKTFKNIEFATSSIHEDFSFYGLNDLESISFGTMKDINKTFVGNNAIRNVYCHSTEPPTFSAATDKNNVFSSSTYLEGTLYVPSESIQLYKEADGWGNFWNIKELSEDGIGEEKPKCAKPHISYNNGILTFFSETESAICYSNITNSDITSYIGNEVQLAVTYFISVYAAKSGYENSDVATATLCWIDVEPKTEGLSDDIAQVRAKAVLIQSMDGQIVLSGIDDGTRIYAYEVSGQQVGSAISHNGQANLTTNFKPGSIVIIKIGERSVKAIIK